jgi:murein tripeptide amidase MpaA
MYHNVDEFESAITNLAAAHPAIAERIPLPEASWELGRTISCLRIGSNAAGAADGVLLLFGQHAREWVPPEIGLNLMADLIDAYTGNHSLLYGLKTYTAAEVKDIVDHVNLFILPCANPDGRFFTQSVNDSFHRLWRRNRNTSYHSSPGCQGVDLNRNYDFCFDLNKYFDTSGTAVLTYTSDDPCNSNQVYHGPSPFSEPETRNIRWLLDTYPRLRWFVDIHSYHSEIYYPWGDDQNQDSDPAMNWRNPAFDHQRGGDGDAYKEYLSPADQATHELLANKLHDGIQAVRGRSYFVTQTFSLYPVSGSSSDWVWARHIVDPAASRVEAFAIEIAGDTADDPMYYGFQPRPDLADQIVLDVTSGLVNFCLATVCGVPGLTAELHSTNVVFNRVLQGRIASRPVILQVTGCEAAHFRVVSGPTRTGGAAGIHFGTAVATDDVPAAGMVVTRDLYLWLTVEGGADGETATGTVRVECPETGLVQDVALVADFVRPLRAGAVLVLDRSGSMAEDGGDGRTRLQVLLDSAPKFVEVAPPQTRVGLVRFATDASAGAPMTTFGAEGTDPPGREVIRNAIAGHTLATGDASMTSIGDGVFAGNDLVSSDTEVVDFKALIVLTDGHENQPRYLSEISALINDRVFAIGLGTPEEIEPIALDTLTHGTGGYLLMTGTLDEEDPYRLEKYFLQILAGVTNDQVVLDPDGWLPFGGSQAIPFDLNEADQSVDTILLIPYPGLVRMRLRTPGGAILDASSPALKWTQADQLGFYRFTLPVPGAYAAEGPGRWQILLDWQRNWKQLWNRQDKEQLFAASTGRHALRYKALVHAQSDLEMSATVGQTKRTPGAVVTVRVSLTQYGSIPIRNARVHALVRYPDLSTVPFYLAPVADGVYETAFTASLSGTYTIQITGEGRTLRGLPFTRQTVRTAAVWPGGDREPPSTDNDSWCGLLQCLLESKAIDPEVLKRMGIDVEAFLRCCRSEQQEGNPAPKERFEAAEPAAGLSARKPARKTSRTTRRRK